MKNQTQEPDCCPEFDPIKWDNTFFTWQNKKFIKDKVCTLFYMPINFGQVMKRMMGKVEKYHADIPDYLCLSDHTSGWSMNIYLAVGTEIEDAENIRLSGNFFSKVYEGNFKDTGKWCKDFESLTKEKGHEIMKLYLWYTTCPKCAKKYGKNYVVIIGQIKG